MKKYIQYLLVLLSIVILTSCGSNSKKDPLAPVEPTIQNTSYYFSNTDDTLLVESYQQYSINFQLNKDGYGFKDAEVRMKSFDSKYGTIQTTMVKTDENGRAAFIYIPPSKIPKAGTSHTIQYVYTVTLENDKTEELVQNITLKFDLKNTGKHENNYYFSDTIDTLLIESSQKYNITFKLNKDGYGYQNGEVKIKSFNSKYGTIENEVITTDKNGRGVFIYSPPEKMPKNGTKYRIKYVYMVTAEDGTQKELVQGITLKFDIKDTPKGEENSYYFSDTVDTLVIESSTKYNITFKLNKDSYGLQDAEIKVKSFNSKYGTIEKETIKTDKNGRGIFVYTPPSKMPKKGTKFTIQYVYMVTNHDGSQKELVQKLVLKFDLKPDNITQNNYYFNETVSNVLVDSYKSYVLSFKLNKDNFVLPGATVKMKTFDSKYGKIEKSTIITDDNGRGQFVYSPPDTMPKAGTKYTIQYVYAYVLEGGVKKELVQNVVLTFNFDENKAGNGRATQLSISYLTTTCNKKRGIIEHYRVHAVDQYSREPIVGVKVNFSTINGIKILNGSHVQEGRGMIKNSKPISFSDSKVNFTGKVSADDLLIILPTQGGKDLSYLGGWSIDDVSKSLQLHGTFNNIKDSKNLTYIIGNEKRLLGGENGSTGKLGSIHVTAINDISDSDGFTYFDLLVDPILGGHTAVLEAHGNEKGTRFGTSVIEFMRTADYKSTDIIIPNSGGVQGVAMHLTIEPGCVGNQPLIDVPTIPASYSVSPRKNCSIVRSQSNYHTNGNGDVGIYIASDGNKTASESCVLHWNGGAGSLSREY